MLHATSLHTVRYTGTGVLVELDRVYRLWSTVSVDSFQCANSSSKIYTEFIMALAPGDLLTCYFFVTKACIFCNKSLQLFV